MHSVVSAMDLFNHSVSSGEANVVDCEGECTVSRMS
jgi:hypothetical protein